MNRGYVVARNDTETTTAAIQKAQASRKVDNYKRYAAISEKGCHGESLNRLN